MTTLYWPTETMLASKDPTVLPDVIRLAALSAIMNAGSGHIGASFSSAEIWASLAVNHPDDVWVSSRGHDAPAYYAALVAAGKLTAASLRTLRQPDGLPGHPETRTAGVAASTGSLGVGLSKAVGIALAEPSKRVYVVCGDGELQEGQTWEAMRTFPWPHDLTVIIDRNGWGSDHRLSWEPTGWLPRSCYGLVDGHDVDELARRVRPPVVIAGTIKGKGVSFMEATGELYGYHSGAPTSDEYVRAVDEIRARHHIECDTSEIAERAPKTAHPVIEAYGRELLAAAERDERIVVLDADLSVDSGLEPFRARFPERFYECGIAEQHMTSMAGGLTLAGRLPVCHTFAAFWRRAVDQVWMNTIDKTHIVYVGSLTREHAAGPSHAAGFDREMFGRLGCSIIACDTVTGVTRALRQALRSQGPVYLRLP